MAGINPIKIRPTDMVRLLNSTEFGTVISERTLRRQRMRAGYTIGDAKTVNLFKYAAYLTAEYLKPASQRAITMMSKKRPGCVMQNLPGPVRT